MLFTALSRGVFVGGLTPSCEMDDPLLKSCKQVVEVEYI